jgi:hypothetical protein
MASCPNLPCTLAEGWHQDRVERKAVYRFCLFCVEVA